MRGHWESVDPRAESPNQQQQELPQQQQPPMMEDHRPPQSAATPAWGIPDRTVVSNSAPTQFPLSV